MHHHLLPNTQNHLQYTFLIHVLSRVGKPILYHTAKNQHRKFETNIPRKGTERPQSQFPHSPVSVSDLYIPTIDMPVCCRKYVDRSWEYINHSQTHECGNWDWGRAIPRKGIHKWDFRCSAHPCKAKNLEIRLREVLQTCFLSNISSAVCRPQGCNTLGAESSNLDCLPQL